MIRVVEERNVTTGVVTVTVADSGTGTYTKTVDGTVVEQRPLTQGERDALDAQAQAEAQATYGTPEVLLNALLTEYASSQSPTDPPPWAQPAGAHDAYLPGAIVAHNGKTWRNDLTVLNVWEPGTQNAGWTDLSPPPSGPQPWVAPTGAHDAYNVGDKVTHNGQTWVSIVAANVWEPGVYGWDVST